MKTKAARTATRPCSCPNIDLAGKFQVIDTAFDPPRWRTLATGFATTANARKVAVEHDLPGIWINDGFGRRYVTV